MMVRTGRFGVVGMCVGLGIACDAGSGASRHHRDAGVSAASSLHNATTSAGEGASGLTSNTHSSGQVDAGLLPLLMPPENAGFDYQLGSAYNLPQGITIVARDRTHAPQPGAYNICYVNGFQVQPGEENDWEADLLLRNDRGEVIVDPNWDEAILDISTAVKRERIAVFVGAWISRCARDGFQAVEIDNLDTYTRTDGRIDEDDAVEFIAKLSAIAHQSSLAIAQKNSVELVSRRREMGTDFVVAEECNTWQECDGYIAAYGRSVLMVEYDSADFERGCGLYGDDYSIVYRDRNLTAPTSGAYVFDAC
jgi:hypothetical protein